MADAVEATTVASPKTLPDEESTEDLDLVSSQSPNKSANLLEGGMSNYQFNELINSVILYGLGSLILVKLSAFDPAITRGWSHDEILTRIPFQAWGSYTAILEESPILTKAITSATVYTIGDVIAQRTEGTGMGELDRTRTFRSALAGFIGHGPLSHYWYYICDDFFDNVLQLTQWWAFFPKVIVDQATWGPFWNNVYILLLGVMKMESLETIWGDMKRTTIPLVVSGLKLWPLAHCITYGVIPVENRLLWVDLVEIVWVTILATQAAGASKDTGETDEAPVDAEEEKKSFATT